MTHLIKNKQEFLKACFPTMLKTERIASDGKFVEGRTVLDFNVLTDFIIMLHRGDMGFYFDKFIIDYINNDSDLLFLKNVLSCKTKKVLLTEKKIVNEHFGMIHIIKEAFNSK
tara:strand:- start:1601 stop:1939 length:339 start_codon:yes stop_codon:yes gene_type:complete